MWSIYPYIHWGTSQNSSQQKHPCVITCQNLNIKTLENSERQFYIGQVSTYIIREIKGQPNFTVSSTFAIVSSCYDKQLTQCTQKWRKLNNTLWGVNLCFPPVHGCLHTQLLVYWQVEHWTLPTTIHLQSHIVSATRKEQNKTMRHSLHTTLGISKEPQFLLSI